MSEAARRDGTSSALELALAKRWWLLGAFVVSGLAGWGLSWLMKPAYRAEAAVVPVHTSSSGLAASLSALTGAGALLGLGLGNDADKNEAIETLQSRAVLRNFIESRVLLAELCGRAAIDCDVESSAAPLAHERNMNSAIRLLRDDLLSVTEDTNTGIIQVTLIWFDRHQAAAWCNDLISLANSTMQSRARDLAARRVEFLKTELAKADQVSMNIALSTLLQNELNRELDAGTRVDYALKVVDPAGIPDDRFPVRPRRAVIGAVAGLFGAMGMFANLLWRNYRKAG